MNAVLRCVTCQRCSAHPWENLGQRRVYKVGHSISRKICPTSGISSGNHKSRQQGKNTHGKYWNHYLLQREEDQAEYGCTVQIHEGLFYQRRRNLFLVFIVVKKRHKGFKLLWGRRLLGFGRDFPVVRTAKHWNELPATSPPWEDLKRQFKQRYINSVLEILYLALGQENKLCNLLRSLPGLWICNAVLNLFSRLDNLGENTLGVLN